MKTLEKILGALCPKLACSGIYISLSKRGTQTIKGRGSINDRELGTRYSMEEIFNFTPITFKSIVVFRKLSQQNN